MLAEMIFAGESENVEFKEDIPAKSEKYMKSVVAFANGTGGKLIFGVQDKTLEIKGFHKDEIFKKMDAITNAIYDSCEPKITPRVAVQEIDGNSVIVVEILEGMQKPYYIKSLGMMEGTFVRVSGTTRKAMTYMVQELIMEGTNRSFDQMETSKVISEQEVTEFCNKMYQYALELCPSDEARKLLPKVSKNQLLSWKLIFERERQIIPSNGYLLLAGDNDTFPEATIQCAVFKGTVRDIFITKKEFSGAIYQQIEDAYHFVLQHINLGSRIEGIARQDIYELPIRTIREMIANAVCHRSFLTPGKIQVALFDDRLEVTSPGMLDNDITIEKMKTGLSKIRNKGIAAALSYMNVIEAWGSGIPRMFREAQEYGLKEPELIDLGSDFRVNLYRAKPEVDKYGVIEKNGIGVNDTNSDTNETNIETNLNTNETNSDTNDTNIDTNEPNFDTNDTNIDTNRNNTDTELILYLIQLNPKIRQKEIVEKTNISLSTVKRIMAKLQKEGKIRRKGSNRFGEWIIEK